MVDINHLFQDTVTLSKSIRPISGYYHLDIDGSMDG